MLRGIAMIKNVQTKHLKINTKADGDIIDITHLIEDQLYNTGLTNGIVTAFCAGSTAIISTMEYEPGLQQDITLALERLAPTDLYYKHHETWHDDNGKSHVKSTMVGPSFTVPFVDKKLTLGTWQQVVFIECDTRSRKREIILQFIGEK